MTEVTKFISFDVWSSNQQWLHDYIDRNDAKSIKTVTIDAATRTLKFYKIENPTVDSVPAFEVEIPTQDLTSYMQKVSNATDNHIGIFLNGSMSDSGIAIGEIATQEYVNQKIIEGVAGVTLTKQIVTSVPDASSAKENVIYLLKVEDATGSDKYEEWTLIGNEVVMIGDTSTDLSDYLTSQETLDKIAAAKQEAIASATSTASDDATAKANQALADAKSYTDSKVSIVTAKVSEIEEDVSANTASIVTINASLTTYGDRIAALESSVNNIQVATTAEALAVFNSVFGTTVTA